MLQYVDDTSFSVQAKEDLVTNLIKMLVIFSKASSLVTNWSKSDAYWIAEKNLLSIWLLYYDWIWIKAKKITKLLKILFELFQSILDKDEFLLNKVKKKLNYWKTTKLSLIDRGIIVNHVLLSTIYYFIGI